MLTVTLYCLADDHAMVIGCEAISIELIFPTPEEVCSAVSRLIDTATRWGFSPHANLSLYCTHT